MHILRINGHNMAYVEQGEGPPQGNRVKEAAPILARNAGSGSFAVFA
jgi:hypothetical protein